MHAHAHLHLHAWIFHHHHGLGLHTWLPAAWDLDRVIPKRRKGGESIHLLGYKAARRHTVHLWHVGQIETARCSRVHGVIINGKVAVAVGVGTRWRNMRWIENIGVDKNKLGDCE